MKNRDILVLFFLGLIVPVFTIQFQSLPGYMDADYYFAGGIQLVKGNGFSEPYLWNYLSDPASLPTPSHAYWMPLASILSAVGMFITRQVSYGTARIGFLLLTVLIPPLTGMLAYRFSANRTQAFLSGLLACFPIYYAPFLPVTDNYSIYMVLGISFFYLLTVLKNSKQPQLQFFLLGLISALMTLARSDGLLWLGMSFLAALWLGIRLQKSSSLPSTNLSLNEKRAKILPIVLNFSKYSASILFGFLLLMAPWYARNASVFGALAAPGGSRILWLREYNDTFIYPASQLTFKYWVASGWDAILQARLKALGFNLLNAFAAQGGIFLFPFILMGIWSQRRDYRFRLAMVAWSVLLVTMTILFPFAGSRGAFFHAGAALQPIWWIAVPIGFDEVVKLIRQRGWFDHRASLIFRYFLVGIVILMTAIILNTRVLPGWEREDGKYVALSDYLVQEGVAQSDVFIVRNPPGFTMLTGYSSIALPPNGMTAILEVATRYHAKYLLLEPEGTSTELKGLYQDPYKSPQMRYLGESDGIRVFEILR